MPARCHCGGTSAQADRHVNHKSLSDNPASCAQPSLKDGISAAKPQRTAGTQMRTESVGSKKKDKRQSDGSKVGTDASQQEGPGFDPQLRHAVFLFLVCMFFPCLCGFPLTD